MVVEAQVCETHQHAVARVRTTHRLLDRDEVAGLPDTIFSAGSFWGVPAGRWSLKVILRDLDTGRVVSSDRRRVRVR